jgi:hypothetical protein
MGFLWLKGDVRNGKREILSVELVHSDEIIEGPFGPNIFNLLTEVATRNSWSKFSSFRLCEIKSADAKE